MCRYGMVIYKVHYVCVPCRQSHKAPWDDREHLCPRCRTPMTYAGHDFAAPRRADDRRWAAVAAVLTAGLRYEGFEPCGCGQQPKYRPRTGSEVRARRRAGALAGLTDAQALSLRDVSDAHPRSPRSRPPR